MNKKAIVGLAAIYILFTALYFLEAALGQAPIEPFRRALIAIPLVNVYNLTSIVPRFVGELVTFLVLNLKYEQPTDIDDLLVLAGDITLNVGILVIVLLIAV